jgi:hypothetical protein
MNMPNLSSPTAVAVSHKRSPRNHWLVLLGLVSLPCVVSQAQLILDPSFESGLTGWATSGDTRTVTGTYGITPVDGTSQALITNNELKSPAPVSASALESFLGLAAGSLTGAGNGNAVEGSAIMQQFTATAGQTLTFSWNFATEENTKLKPDWAFNDFGFAMVRPVGQTGDQSNVATLATVKSLVLDIFTANSQILPFGSQAQLDFKTGATGYRTFSYTVPSDGTYVLGIGVLDVGTGGLANIGNSGVLVDNVNLAPVPEPKTWSFAAGLALCAVAVGRRLRSRMVRGAAV